MILHKCDRCGSLSDDEVGLRAQNKYEDWLRISFIATKPDDDRWGAQDETLEVCKTCKTEFNRWKDNVIREEIRNGQ